MRSPSAVFDGEAWRALLEILLAPVSWIPAFQDRLVAFLLEGSSAWVVAARIVLLLLPLLLLAAGLWSTMLGSYTLVARPQRRRFLAALAVAWCDAARASWLYWTGLVRFSLVALGWALGFSRLGLILGVEAFRSLLIAPLWAAGRLVRRYFRPGLPWLAVLLLIGWCLLESSVFTHAIFPSVSGWFVERLGVETPGGTGPILHVLLFLLVLGSFASLDALLRAFGRRDLWRMAGLLPGELFVGALEIGVLYGTLVGTGVAAVTEGGTAASGSTWRLWLAAGAWLGVRSLGWLLFGRAGSPALLAIVARRRLERPGEDEDRPTSVEDEFGWRLQPGEFRQELEWLHRRSDELVEGLTLPVLQVVAAVLNFMTIVLTTRPVFDLPLQGIREFSATRQILSRIRLPSEGTEPDLPGGPTP